MKTLFVEPAGSVSEALRTMAARDYTLILTETCHVGPEFGHATVMTPRLLPPIERYDRKLLNLLAKLAGKGLCETIARTQNSRHLDGVMAILTMFQACAGTIKRGRLLHYDQMLKDGTHSAVSFASVAFDRVGEGP